MIEYYKTTKRFVEKIDSYQEGCWINVVDPNRKEKLFLIRELGILEEFVKSSLDRSENAHMDYDDDVNQTLFIIDCPHLVRDETATYNTYPLGIVICNDYIVTISLSENTEINEIINGKCRGIQTQNKIQFFLHFMLRISQKYLIYLQQIDHYSTELSSQLRQSMRNEELLSMLALEKSLIYFSTSLKSDEVTLKKLKRCRQFKLTEDDYDLLDDVLIEIDQANEMSHIYKDVLNGTMDTFSNIIANNLNFSMKDLTIITISMEVPNMVFGFYGMNVSGLPMAQAWFPFFFSIVFAFLVFVIVRKIR
ncbi:magnesium transporter CorA family protein [Floccifex sp.]|uniref:magnesium transporter CorA family protein n=1 Tax=Floccifex sp. TaxID=2815810 RepID=UPI003F03B8EB